MDIKVDPKRTLQLSVNLVNINYDNNNNVNNIANNSTSNNENNNDKLKRKTQMRVKISLTTLK